MAINQHKSPGIIVNEIDQSNFPIATAATIGGTVGTFNWGPVNLPLLVGSSNELIELFDKPSNTRYVDWFSVSNFLSYSGTTYVVRVVDSTSISPATNSSSDGSGILIKNRDHFYQTVGVGASETDLFVAKYPGVLGNSIKVSLADSATFDTWAYKSLFDFAPGTSDYAAALGAANDELHVVVVDSNGKFTGVSGNVLEKYSFVSKASDAKGSQNEPNYYINVINETSNYVWAINVLRDSTYLDIEKHLGVVTIGDGGTNYGKPIITFTDDDEEGNPIGRGGAAEATIDANGVITDITVTNVGTGYKGPVTVGITDSGEGATAAAVLANGVITDVTITNPGKDYYTADVTITDSGAGATATAVMASTGAVKTAALNAGGTGYSQNDVLTITGGTGTFTVATVDGNGVILTGSLTSGGANYSTIGAATGVALTGGNGSNATVDIVVGKAIASFTMGTNGSNYTTARVVLTGGTPSVAATISPVVANGRVTGITVSAGGSGYVSVPSVAIYPGGQNATATATIGELGSALEGQIIDITVTNGGTNYGNPIITISPGGAGATATVALVSDTDDTNWGLPAVDDLGVPVSYYSLKENTEGSVSFSLYGGSDGELPTSSDLIDGWNLYSNVEDIDVNLLYLSDGGGSSNNVTVAQHVIDNISEKRKDCVVFISPPLTAVLNKTQVQAVNGIKTFINGNLGLNRNTSYAVIDSGWKLTYDKFFDVYRWVPLNADIAGLCASTDFDLSPAGLERGRVKNVASLAFNPNTTSRDELYKINVNPVVVFKGEGPILYGDKTLKVKNSVFSYINVRRLFIDLEKTISKAAKAQLFEFNNDLSRLEFVNTIDPILRRLQAKGSIVNYFVKCDETNNTSDVINNGEFVADIYITPARSINFITLNFVAVRNGVQFTEFVGSV